MQIIEIKRLDQDGRMVEAVPGVQITRHGLVFRQALTVAEFQELGQTLASYRKASAWMEADYYTHGRMNFPDQVGEVCEQLELGFAGNEDKLLFLGNIPHEKRRPGLTFNHYLQLQGLPEKEQSKWVKTALAERLTPMDLKRSIAQGEVVRGSAERTSGFLTIQAISQDLMQWWRKVDIEQMTEQNLEVLLKEFELAEKIRAEVVAELEERRK